jgi:hypothetical protein
MSYYKLRKTYGTSDSSNLKQGEFEIGLRILSVSTISKYYSAPKYPAIIQQLDLPEKEIANHKSSLASIRIAGSEGVEEP